MLGRSFAIFSYPETHVKTTESSVLGGPPGGVGAGSEQGSGVLSPLPGRPAWSEPAIPASCSLADTPAGRRPP